MKQKTKEWFEKRKEDVKQFYQDHKFEFGYTAAAVTVIAMLEVIRHTAKCDRVDIGIGHNSDTDGDDITVIFEEINKRGRKVYGRSAVMSLDDAEKMVEVLRDNIEDRRKILNKD